MKSIILFRSFIAMASVLAPFTSIAADVDNTNPYASHYEKRLDAPLNKPAVANVRIYRGDDKETDDNRLLEDGYDMLGASSFRSGEVSPDMAVAHAKNINADLVMVYSVRFGQTPKEVQANNAKAKAKEKVVNPNIDKNLPEIRLLGGLEYSYDYLATFWTKLPTPTLGLHVKDRTKNDKRPGVQVIAVVKQSPAAKADIRRGDVVLRIAGVETNNGGTLVNTVQSNAGKTVEIVWLRGDTQMQETVVMNAP